MPDDTPDPAATMAERDKRLQQAEIVARWTECMEGRRSPRRPADDEAGAADEASAEDESPGRRGPEPDPQLAI